MTRANVLGGGGSVPERPPSPDRRKALLFCPRCGHRNPADGDWIVTGRGEGVELRCPVCREWLTTRAIERSTTNR